MMSKPERTTQNVIVFPARRRRDGRSRADESGFPGIDPYGDGANLEFTFQNEFIARHFGSGWRGLISTGLTAAAMTLLIAIVCGYC